MMYCLLMRFTALTGPWKKCCIRPLKILALDIMIGKGPSARSLRIDLPPFTLIGATTKAGMLTGPLRDRFGVIERLEFYTVEELQQIVTRSADILAMPIEEAGALEIARRSGERLVWPIACCAGCVFCPGKRGRLITKEIADRQLNQFGN